MNLRNQKNIDYLLGKNKLDEYHYHQDYDLITRYEKGVEKYMTSCASGSVASCYDAFKKLLIQSPVTIINPGGELFLEFNDNWENAWLAGPVNIISQVQY